MQKAHNSLLKDIIRVFDELKHNFGYKDGILCIVAITVLTISTMFTCVNKVKTYVINVDNKSIGYVDNIDTYQKAVDDIKALNGDEPLKHVTAKRTDKLAGNLLTSTQIEKVCTSELGLKVPALAISANGIELAIVKSSVDVKKTIEGIKKYYYPEIANGSYIVTSSKIKEGISTRNILTDEKNILNINQAIKKIVSGRGAEKTYTVKDGDTIWDIALSNNVDIEDIQAANPKLDINKIKIGQLIKLAVKLPYVNVEIAADVKSKEQIPYDTKNKTDKNLRRGVKKIAQRGKSGLAEIDKIIKIVNGDVVSENVKNSKVLVAAKDEVIILGGKIPEYVATGSFMRPSRGRLTSVFGRRWGRMHEGVDLAGPTGTPIYAADSGKVSFAGWRNGYGLCILINHGHGIQTLYGHTSKVYVKAGQSVKKGQRIAAEGSTGHVTGPHLHFEVRKNGAPVNPLAYLHIR